ncbi:DUF2461 domain-containing protein [Shewanella litorisediminis]|uniref:DUF2461 domain-containing protein n=1 Tax=Shewanella litorisediminis TaxID=1173586 RepID=A0ABX7G6C7_9GAMM|nr:DUF2461 domain-containing protein [Shewanella litorisediminis]MCL2917709.1 DUF2461 domain-containing protein [Shewanella litorisediminis]QRH02829.1 DUF2461 domain-containing protein [Shewanella litorisediminis]
MFSQATFDFLAALEAHNERYWFKANQQTYEDQVRSPALKLIEAAAPGIAALSPRLTAVARKVGGSLMRPQRDTRFGHDKRPYKTNVGIQFRHFQGKDVHAPGLYLHIANDGCFVGAGIWHPEPKTLNAIRSCIDENPAAYQKALKALTDGGFAMDGGSLSRPPRGFDKGHPLIDELKRKDFIAVKPLTNEEILRPDFASRLTAGFEHCQQLMRYLCFALELDY